MADKSTQWSGRMGFILASLGMAFGAGNIWRFPRVVAENDGGAFLIAFIVANLIWTVPLLMIEMIMGKTTRLGTVGAFRDFVGPGKTWMGAWIGMCCVLIMFYYSVVTGWSTRYLLHGIVGAIRPGIDSELMWNDFLLSPAQTILFHFIAMAIAGFIMLRGVQRGLELANKIIVPSIVVLLAVLMVWALSKPGAVMGMEYLFRPNLAGLLKAKTWLNAFTQAAWSVGAGWGLMLTYAVYMSDREDIGANSFVIAFADSGSSLLAAMAILPLVFAVSPAPDVALEALQSGNSGLTFVYLTRFFATLPLGSLLAGIFFLALAISALASLLSMVELLIQNLSDTGISRRTAVLATVAVGFLFGIPSAVWPKFLDNQDTVWGVGLLISGLFYAYAVYRNGLERTRAMINAHSWIHVGRWFNLFVVAMPVVFSIVFGWWVWQAVQWYPETWWNPFEKLSPATMALQWALLLGIVCAANRWLSRKVNAGRAKPEVES